MFARYVASPFLAILAIAEAVRFFQQWSMATSHVSVPLWANGVGSVAFATLAFAVWREFGPTRR
jgi:hypothetical protein